MQAEIEILQQKILEVTSERDMKERMTSQQVDSSKDQQRLLNEHIAKLQSIIESKTEMNSTLDSQNQTLHQELSKHR